MNPIFTPNTTTSKCDDHGTEFLTRSTYGAEGDTSNSTSIRQPIRPGTGGSQQLLDRGGRLSRFNSRFGNLAFGKK